MQLFRDLRRLILTALLSISLAALLAVSRRLALTAEERRVLAERVEATLMLA